MRPLTPELLAAATGAPKDCAERYFEPLVAAMGKFVIDGLYPTCAFLAQIAIESNRLTQPEESLYYTNPEHLALTFRRVFDTNHDKVLEPSEIEACKPYLCNHGNLSQVLYSGFHGRGLLGLTWERNYAAASAACGYDYVSKPDLVKEPVHAALTAAWFFSSNGCCPLSGDINAVTKIINPAMLAAGDRARQYDIAKKLMLA